MIEQQYIDLFEQYRSELDRYSSEAMNSYRDAAFETFKNIGFPTSQNEDYKHSNIARAFDADLGLNLRNIPIPVNPYDAFKCDVPNLSTNLYFLINDRYYDKNQHLEFLPEGVFVGSLQVFFLLIIPNSLKNIMRKLQTTRIMVLWHTTLCLLRMDL